MSLVNGKIVGKGERTVLELCEELFPNYIIIHQVNYSALMNDFHPGFRQEKESIDIMLMPKYTNLQEGEKLQSYAVILIRVNFTDHKGRGKSRVDNRQARDLKEAGYGVVDIDWYEAKEIFKERTNEKSRKELIDAFLTAGFVPIHWKGEMVGKNNP